MAFPLGRYAILKARNPTLLVESAIDMLVGDEAVLSLEGFSLPEVVLSLEDVSWAETDVLRRNTIEPKLDFVVVPLDASRAQTIKEAIAKSSVLSDETGGLVHLQIAKDGRLVFGAYDNVHPECTVVYEPYVHSFTESLLKNGAVESYSIGNHVA